MRYTVPGEIKAYNACHDILPVNAYHLHITSKCIPFTKTYHIITQYSYIIIRLQISVVKFDNNYKIFYN